MAKVAIEQPRFEPQPGPQRAFLASRADIAIYGGGAGGGKSYALCLDAARWLDRPGYSGVMFRRTYPEISAAGGLLDQTRAIYSQLGGKLVDMDWRWPDDAKIQLRHLQHEKDVYSHQGAQYAFIGFDEATHFTAHQFWYLQSRNRSTAKVEPYTRLTCNPDPDSFLSRLIDWWIDEAGYPIRERSGVLRYFVRRNEQMLWADSREECARLYSVQPDSVRSLTFIPATLEDNPRLAEADPGYRARLESLGEVEQARLLRGNWKVRQTGKLFKTPAFAPWPENLQPRAWVDPAYGGKDTTALVIGGWTTSHFHCQCWAWRESVDVLYQRIVDLCSFYGAGTLYVDQTGDHGLSLPGFKRLWPAVQGRGEKQNKHVKIVSALEPDREGGVWSRVRFAPDQQRDALNQILAYEESVKPCDVPDALACLIREIGKPARKGFAIGANGEVLK